MDTSRIQTALHQLHYSWADFTLDDFVAHVAGYRQRPIELLGVAGFDHSGLCMSTRSKDYIFFDTVRHPVVQRHAIVHETAHLVLNHIIGALDQYDAQQLKDVLRQMWTRAPLRIDNPALQHQEDEAEYFAFLVQQAVEESQYRKQSRLTDNAADMYLPPFTGDFLKDS